MWLHTHTLQWTPFLEPRSGIGNSFFFFFHFFIPAKDENFWDDSSDVGIKLFLETGLPIFFFNLGCFMKIAVFSSLRDLLEAIFFWEMYNFRKGMNHFLDRGILGIKPWQRIVYTLRASFFCSGIFRRLAGFIASALLTNVAFAVSLHTCHVEEAFFLSWTGAKQDWLTES